MDIRYHGQSYSTFTEFWDSFLKNEAPQTIKEADAIVRKSQDTSVNRPRFLGEPSPSTQLNKGNPV